MIIINIIKESGLDMELVSIVFTSLGSVLVLFLLTKIMGYRQMSQLSMFDYINGITIGSIAAEMATSLEDDFLKPLIAMVVYGGVAVLTSLLTNKFIRFRRIVSGKSLILYDNNKLFQNNLRKAKMDIDEFLIQCRNNGYFNLSDIQTAILESNGKVSFLPVSNKRPVNPQDMNLNPQKESILINVILDGKILKKNLKETGNDEVWLRKQLKNLNNVKLSEIFLATCDYNNNLQVFKRENYKGNNDKFQ